MVIKLTLPKKTLEIDEEKKAINLHIWVEEPAHKNSYQYKVQFFSYKLSGKEIYNKYFANPIVL